MIINYNYITNNDITVLKFRKSYNYESLWNDSINKNKIGMIPAMN